MITHVAVRASDGEVFSAPAPARHHNVIADIHYAGKRSLDPNDQGFIDDEYGFVSRLAAADIAMKSGQIERLKWPPMLYSEDLW